MVGDILQPTHLLFILVVALLVLGPKRLPEVGRTLGSGLRDFRQAINGDSNNQDEREPQAYVETEPDSTPPYVADESDDAADTATVIDSDISDPAFDDIETTATEPVLDETETATTEPADDAEFAASASAASAPSRAATTSSAGFASALAASRQRPSGDDEPADAE